MIKFCYCPEPPDMLDVGVEEASNIRGVLGINSAAAKSCAQSNLTY